MRRFLFFSKGDGGVALIAVVFTVALVLALFVMAFKNALVGKLVTDRQLDRRLAMQCGQAALVIANGILVQAEDSGTLPENPPGVTINRKNGNEGGLPGQDATVINLIEEFRGSHDLAADSPLTANDIKIEAGNCTTYVDIDFLSHDSSPGEDGAIFMEYHGAAGGTACGDGNFYSVVAVTQMAGRSETTVNSAFHKC